MGESIDTRGGEGRIARVLGFDTGAFVHMLAYRVLIFASLATGIAILATALLFQGSLESAYIEALVLVVWALFTVEVYAVAKAAVLIASRGRFSPDLNRSFVSASGGSPWLGLVCAGAPYAATAAWVIGFAAIFAMWFL